MTIAYGRRAGVLLVAVLLSVAPLHAAQGGSFQAVLPGLQRMPAPAWVQEGVRISLYSSAATIPTTRFVAFRDADGAWVDEQGNRYRVESTGGASGHGVTQVNVATLNPSEAALCVRSYGYVNGSGPLTPLASHSVVGPPACAGDFWIHPQALAQLGNQQVGGMRVIRMPYHVGGQTYSAIRFQYENGQSRTVNVYDLQSGVLLHQNQQTRTAHNNIAITQSTFLGVRRMALPWRGAAAPAWASRLSSLSYQGRFAVMVPGSPAIPLPLTIQALIHGRGSNWAQYRLTTRIQGPGSMPNQEVHCTGSSTIGGIWLPTAGLRGLQQGQVLDQDPVTGVVVRVAGWSTGADGRTTVTLTEANQAYRKDWTYDGQSGMLLACRYHDGVLNHLVEIQLAAAN